MLVSPNYGSWRLLVAGGVVGSWFKGGLVEVDPEGLVVVGLGQFADQQVRCQYTSEDLLLGLNFICMGVLWKPRHR